MQNVFQKRKISIIGSTGSIGTQALQVLERLQDKFEITALAGGSNTDLLWEQVQKFKPKYVSSEVYDKRLASIAGCTYIPNGIEEICSNKKENDIIVDYAEYRKEINILSEKIEETKNKKQKVKIFFGKRNNLEK